MGRKVKVFISRQKLYSGNFKRDKREVLKKQRVPNTDFCQFIYEIIKARKEVNVIE